MKNNKLPRELLSWQRAFTPSKKIMENLFRLRLGGESNPCEYDKCVKSEKERVRTLCSLSPSLYFTAKY